MEKTEPVKVDRRIRRTKNIIKKTLLLLISEKKTARITVSELTERADINRKTFYNHYSDINAVLTDLENELSEKILNHISEHDFARVFEHPETILNFIMEELNNNLEFYRLMLESEVHLVWFRQFKDKLTEAVRRSSLRDFFEQNPSMEIFLEFICTGLVAAVQNFIESPRGMTNEDFCRMMAMLFKQANETYLQYAGFYETQKDEKPEKAEEA